MVAEVLMRHVRKYVSPVLCMLLACSHAAPRGAAPIRIEEATIDELQAAMAAGELTSYALVQHYLDRIARYDKQGPKLNAFLLVNPRALEEADRGHVRRHRDRSAAARATRRAREVVRIQRLPTE